MLCESYRTGKITPPCDSGSWSPLGLSGSLSSVSASTCICSAAPSCASLSDEGGPSSSGFFSSSSLRFFTSVSHQCSSSEPSHTQKWASLRTIARWDV